MDLPKLLKLLYMLTCLQFVCWFAYVKKNNKEGDKRQKGKCGQMFCVAVCHVLTVSVNKRPKIK